MLDGDDNCDRYPNPPGADGTQSDADGDGLGDVCDPDDDDDGLSDRCELGCLAGADPLGVVPAVDGAEAATCDDSRRDEADRRVVVSDDLTAHLDALVRALDCDELDRQAAALRAPDEMDAEPDACLLPTGLITDPFDRDTDGDGMSDHDELTDHTKTNPRMGDTDRDGLCDATERATWVPRAIEAPSDGAIELCGADRGTSPAHEDTDLDGMSDGDEDRAVLRPDCRDTDGDGLDDGDERLVGTNPRVPDTDSDGVDDGDEVQVGEGGVISYASDPLDRGDTPNRPTRGELVSGCRAAPGAGGSGVGWLALALLGLACRRRQGRACRAGVVAAVLLVGAATADAQQITETLTGGYDTTVFREWSTDGGFSTVGSGALPHVYTEIMLAATYIDTPVRLRRDPDTYTGPDDVVPLIDRRLHSSLGVGLGLFDRFELRGHLPLVVDSVAAGRGDDYAAESVADGLGDLGLLLKGTIIDGRRAPLGVAVAAVGNVPLGETSLHSDGQFVPEALVAVDALRLVPGLSLTANAGVRWRSTARAVSEDPVGPQVAWAGTVGYDAHRSGFGVVRRASVLVEARGAEEIEGRRDPRQLLFGGRVQLAPVVIGVGLGLTLNRQAGGSGRFAAMLGLAWQSQRDRDGDDLEDALDLCPDGGEDYDGFEDADGCADTDNDGDGIPDVDDGAEAGAEFGRCRDEPEDFDGFEDQDGCPELDNDRDGLPDDIDQCRDVPEDHNGVVDDDGCPDGDSDGDGALDYQDDCPDVPCVAGETCEAGCPDTDGDGVLDRIDACRTDPCLPGQGCYLGCPDSDDDAVPDAEDACPGEIEDEPDSETADGCPGDGADRDGDGMPDQADRCPDRKDYVRVNYANRDGCPKADRDKDEVPDEVDRCPDDKEDLYTGRVDGCPGDARPEVVEQSTCPPGDDLPDSDGDGLPDCNDECPALPEDHIGTLDGCPEA